MRTFLICRQQHCPCICCQGTNSLSHASQPHGLNKRVFPRRTDPSLLLTSHPSQTLLLSIKPPTWHLKLGVICPGFCLPVLTNMKKWFLLPLWLMQYCFCYINKFMIKKNSVSKLLDALTGMNAFTSKCRKELTQETHYSCDLLMKTKHHSCLSWSLIVVGACILNYLKPILNFNVCEANPFTKLY